MPRSDAALDLLQHWIMHIPLVEGPRKVLGVVWGFFDA